MDRFFGESDEKTLISHTKKSATYKLWHIYPFLFSRLDYHTQLICLADTQIVCVKILSNHYKLHITSLRFSCSISCLFPILYLYLLKKHSCNKLLQF